MGVDPPEIGTKQGRCGDMGVLVGAAYLLEDRNGESE
jgi:hypothetical protein